MKKQDDVNHISSVQSLSHFQLFATPWTATCQASLSIPNSWNLLKLMSIELGMPFNHFILCCPLLLLASIFPSIRVFSNESVFTWGGQSIGVSASTSVLYWKDSLEKKKQDNMKKTRQCVLFVVCKWKLELPWWLSWWRIRLQCMKPQFDSWVVKMPWRMYRLPTPVFLDFPGGLDCKEFACNVGDLGLILGLGRSPGGGHGNPLQYSCLETTHGQRILAGYSPQGRKESDTTEWLSTAQHMKIISWT